jgi:hypothetical protein
VYAVTSTNKQEEEADFRKDKHSIPKGTHGMETYLWILQRTFWLEGEPRKAVETTQL